MSHTIMPHWAHNANPVPFMPALPALRFDPSLTLEGLNNPEVVSGPI